MYRHRRGDTGPSSRQDRGRYPGDTTSQIDDLDGGIEAGQVREAGYVAQRYHQVGDNYTPGVQLGAGLEIVELLRAIGARLASESTFPNWNVGNEFRAARDRSRGAEGAR